MRKQKNPANTAQNNEKQAIPSTSVSKLLAASASTRDAFLDGNPALKNMGSVRPTAQYFTYLTGQWSADSTLYDLFDEMLHHDPQIYGLMDARIDAVTSRPSYFTPASPDPQDQLIAAFVERCLEGRAFAQLCETLLRSIGRGLTIVEIDWQLSDSIDVPAPGEDGTQQTAAAKRWAVPAAFVERHPALFVFDRDHVIYLSAGQKKEKLDPRRLLLMRYEETYHNPYGDGVLNRVYFYYQFKKMCIRAWSSACERFGTPTLVGRSKGSMTPEIKIQFLAALEDIQNNSNIVMPENLEVELLQAASAMTNNTGPENLLHYLDEKISVAFSGSTLTSSEGQRSGSLALGQVHNQVRMEKIAGDARILEDVINNQLIRALVDFNFGPSFAAPRWAIDTELKTDLSEEIKIDTQLLKSGIPLGRKYFYETYGRPEPQEGELTLLHNDSDLFQYHLQYGVLTINEVRARLGLPAVSWGDLPSKAALEQNPLSPAAAPPAPDRPASQLESETALDTEADTDTERMSENAAPRAACACFADHAPMHHADPRPALIAHMAARQDQYRAARRARFERTLRLQGETITPQALRHALQFSQDSMDDPPTPDSWIDPDLLAEDLTLLWGIGHALELERLARELPARPFFERAARRLASFIPFRGDASAVEWVTALERFAGKQTVPAADFELWLNAIDRAAKQGLLPDARAAQQQCYKETFTMVREANHKILDGVDKLIQKTIDGKIGTGDFVQDVDDLYRSFGLAEQKGWYVQLVLDNAANRAYQEARDLVSHDVNPNTGAFEAKRWVWGYEWDHGNPARPRPSHLSMDGYKAPVDSPIWGEFGQPPIGHGCLCTRWTIGQTRAIEEGLASRSDFTPPTVTRAHLEASGANADDMLKYEGRPAGYVLANRPGDRFERSNFNIPARPFINPSGLPGQFPLIDSRRPEQTQIFPW